MFKSFGDHLRGERYLQSMTQKEAASCCDIGRTQYQKYEYDIVIPKVKNCKKLAKGLRIDEKELLRIRAKSLSE